MADWDFLKTFDKQLLHEGDLYLTEYRCDHSDPLNKKEKEQIREKNVTSLRLHRGIRKLYPECIYESVAIWYNGIPVEPRWKL